MSGTEKASCPPQSERILSLIADLESQRDTMLELTKHVLGGAGADMFTCDFLAIGTIKRYLSTVTAFRLMIETWNMQFARAILRMNIDTALRFSAIWLVSNKDSFASKILGGERIDTLKDRTGNLMRDAYLVKLHSKAYPWLPTVYKNLSGYIHLSGSHIFDSVTSLESSTNKIEFVVSDKDTKFPESSWVEVINCFVETTSILSGYLSRYATEKHSE